MQALVIDDSRAMRSIIGGILRDLDFEVAEASNGVAALEVLRKLGVVALALVDWNMPEMNGLEFVRAVRADPRYAEMRLVMVTTETELSQVSEALEAGADEYVMKPFTQDALLAKLESAGLGLPNA